MLKPIQYKGFSIFRLLYIMDYFDKLGDKMYHMHIIDGRHDSDDHVMPGEGDMPLPELMQELKEIKKEMDKHAQFGRAAKPYLDAEKLMKDKENYAHFDDIAAMYEESKVAAEAARQAQIDEQKRLEEEKNAKAKQLKLEKEAAKRAKKK